MFPTSACIGFGFVSVSKLRVSNVGPTCLGVSVPLGLGVSIASLGWLLGSWTLRRLLPTSAQPVEGFLEAGMLDVSDNACCSRECPRAAC